MKSWDQKWEQFAQENPEYYIETPARRLREVDRENFFAGGERASQLMLEECGQLLRRRGVAVEIGCGVGRVAIPISREFERVIAIDVAPTMLRKLRAYCDEMSISNVEPHLASEGWDDGLVADFIYTYLVFQHIPSMVEIDRYSRRIAGCLAVEGVCYVQVDTRPRSARYWVRYGVPDSLLPHSWRKGARRVWRPPNTYRAKFEANGLSVAREFRPRSATHAFVLTRQRRNT